MDSFHFSALKIIFAALLKEKKAQGVAVVWFPVQFESGETGNVLGTEIRQDIFQESHLALHILYLKIVPALTLICRFWAR